MPQGTAHRSAVDARRRAQRAARRLVLAAAAAAVPLPTVAAEQDWKSSVTTGLWSDTNNWVQGTVPTAGDNAFIVNAVATNQVAIYDYSGPAITLGNLRVDNTGGGTNTLFQVANTLAVTTETIGFNGNGMFVQSGGAHSSTIYVELGRVAGSFGVYNQSGGSFTTPTLYVGMSGSGAFAQSNAASTTTVSGSIGSEGFFIGYGAGSSGTYTLAGGSLSVLGTEYVGLSGQGNFSQTGGSHSVSKNLYLGNNASGVGVYAMDGGTLSVTQMEYVGGNAGNGTFIQTGGTHSVATYVEIGLGTSSAGLYNQSGGSLTVPDLYVGGQGSGTFLQTGGATLVNGATSATNGLYVGFAAGGTDSYAMSNSASLVVTTIGGERIGYGGNGAFSQTGGSNNASTLILGFNPSTGFSTGSYDLSDGGLTVNGAEYVGYIRGQGLFNQSGGTHVVGGSLLVGTLSSGTNLAPGVYTQTGGVLSVSPSEYIGYQGIGNFVQSGGTHSVGGPLYIGDGAALGGVPNASGTYAISADGLLTATSLYVGNQGNGAFTQAGGAANISGTAYVAFSAGSTGRLNLNGGSFTADTLRVSAGGIVNHTGGSLLVSGISPNIESTNTASGSGLFVDGGGAYSLTNGTLAVPNADVVIGDAGSGSFTQAGGSHTFGSPTNPTALRLGRSATGVGLYTLADGVLNANNNEYIGEYGQGSFVQTGGTNAMKFDGSFGTEPQLVIGYQLGSSGSYVLSGGTLLMPRGEIAVGWKGAGTFNQAGGQIVNASQFHLGYNSNGAGLYTLTGGTLDTQIMTVGFNGPGTVNQIGGVITTDVLYVGINDPTTGSYAMSNGASLTVNHGESIGEVTVGTFIQTGGTHVIGTGTNFGALVESEEAAPRPTPVSFILSGGTLDLRGDHFIGVLGQATFLQTGGAYHLTGGTTAALAGMILGQFNYANGYPLPSGTATLSGGTLQNDATLYLGYYGTGKFIQSGGTHTVSNVQIAGTGGTGSYNLSGGNLAVSGSMTVGQSDGGFGTFNQSGGTATVGSLFVRNVAGATGQVNLTGGTFSAGPTLNNGQINAAAGLASFGPITGVGALNVGNVLSGTADTSVTSFNQSTVNIYRTGRLSVIGAVPPHFVNTATTLAISGTGVLDLGNSALLVNNAATPEATVRQYLHSAYNADASGIGDWNGNGGITSADAIASHNGANPDFRISIGYVNGAYANDPLLNGPIPGQETLSPIGILVRPALYGDLNLDGKVDDTDLAIFSGLGQYNKPNPKFGWLGGDLNYDGKVDDTDLLIFSGAGNYNGPAYGAGAVSLTGRADGNGGADAVFSTATEGHLGDGILDFIYDPTNGHLTIHYDGDPRITAAQPLQVIRLKSAAGLFIPGNFQGLAFGAGVTATNLVLNGTASGANSVPDGYDLGAVLPAALKIGDVEADLTLQWNVFGGGLTLKAGDVYISPEPASLAAVGMISGGLLRRRRKRASRPRTSDAVGPDDGWEAGGR